MEVQKAYDLWSTQYDTNLNRTRDLEGQKLREQLAAFPFNNCLEIGCGTGKNTSWLASKAQKVTGVDLSMEMLAKAKEKVGAANVEFVQADINEHWHFATSKYDLVSFSLVLEHIQDLDSIFQKAAAALHPGGIMYIGELHPFKQYAGSKARFEMNNETVVVDCFTHHISDYLNGSKRNGLALVEFKEVFDEDDLEGIPRLIVMVFGSAGSP